jgi:hypothetical protein
MSIHHYLMDDCSIEVPDGFRDLTAHALSWELADGSLGALLIQREPKPADLSDLGKYVDEQTHDYPTRFAGFHLESREVATEDSPFPMARQAFRWHGGADVFYHHQAFVLRGATVLVFTAAAKAPHRQAIDEMLDLVLKSFAVRAP